MINRAGGFDCSAQIDTNLSRRANKCAIKFDTEFNEISPLNLHANMFKILRSSHNTRGVN